MNMKNYYQRHDENFYYLMIELHST